jgi:hypothetical protein
VTSPTPDHPVAPPRALHWSVGAPLGAVAGVSAAVAGLVADRPALGLLGALVAAVPAVLAGRRVPALHRQVAECSSRAEVARAAAELAAERAGAALAAAERVVAERLAEIAAAENEASLVRPFVAEIATVEATVAEPAVEPVDLVRRTPRHRSSAPSAADVVVDLVKRTVGPAPAPAPAVAPAPVPVMMAPAASRATAPAARAMAFAADTTRPEARSEGESDPEAASEGDPRVDTAELQRIWDLGEAPRPRSGRGRRARLGAEVDALPDRPAHVAGMRRRARHRR